MKVARLEAERDGEIARMATRSARMSGLELGRRILEPVAAVSGL